MIRHLLAGTGLIGYRHLGHILDHPQIELADISQVDVPADGILIATPTEPHVRLGIAAVERGWHVLVEKPIADCLAAADRMIATAWAASVHLLVGHPRRHHPRVARLREFVTSGAIGQRVAASLLWAMSKDHTPIGASDAE